LATQSVEAPGTPENCSSDVPTRYSSQMAPKAECSGNSMLKICVVGFVVIGLVCVNFITSSNADAQRSAHVRRMIGERGAQRSGTIDNLGQLRQYQSDWCGKTFTLPQLHKVFAAHAVEWNLMGRDAAWWSVLTEYPKEAEIPESAKLEFYASGQQHITTVFNDLGIDGHTRKRRALDFGCGLGRLAFAFAEHFDEVSCVDQSISHLLQAEREWADRFKASTSGTVTFDVSSLDLLAALGGRKFDLVHTHIVLQHMVPPLQQTYLEQLCDALELGGRGWLHIPVDNHHSSREATCDIEWSVSAGGMQMHFTAEEYLKPILRQRGCATEFKPVNAGYGVGECCEAAVLLLHKVRAPPSPAAE